MCMLLTCVRRDDCKPCATKVCHLRLRACTRDAPAMRGAQWQSIPVGAMCRGGARLIMPFHTATTPQAHTATRHTRPYPRPAAQTGVAVTRESWRLEVEPVLPSRSRPALYVQTTVRFCWAFKIHLTNRPTPEMRCRLHNVRSLVLGAAPPCPLFGVASSWTELSYIVYTYPTEYCVAPMCAHMNHYSTFLCYTTAVLRST